MVAVRAEPVGDPVVRAPRVEVREHHVDEAVVHLGVRQRLGAARRRWSPRARGGDGRRARCGRRRRRARGAAPGRRSPGRSARRPCPAAVGLPLEVGAGEAVRRDRPGERAERVVLGDRVAHAGQQLRVGGDHVVRLHEGLLRDLPVAAQDLADVHLLEAVLERPVGELRGEVAEVLGERVAQSGSRFTNTNPPHVSTCTGGRSKSSRSTCSKSHLHGACLNEPSRFHAKPWKAQRSSSSRPSYSLQHPAAVPADVAERADGVGRRPHDEDRDADDVVGDVVADLGDVLLAAGHLPDPLPHLLDLEPVELGEV